MSRVAALVGVAALLLGALSGCTLDAPSLNVMASANEREQLIAGSFDSVVASTHGSLVKLHVDVKDTNEGDSVRLSSATPSGKKFDLILTRVQSPNGEQTRVRIDWKGDKDNAFWFQLVEALAVAELSEKHAR